MAWELPDEPLCLSEVRPVYCFFLGTGARSSMSAVLYINAQLTEMKTPVACYRVLHASQPFLSFEQYQHPCGNDGHHDEDDRITPSPFEFRHILEVHSVKADNE